MAVKLHFYAQIFFQIVAYLRHFSLCQLTYELTDELTRHRCNATIGRKQEEIPTKVPAVSVRSYIYDTVKAKAYCPGTKL